jgi:hypothetical protein
MRIGTWIVVMVCVLRSSATATPSEEELLPIDIPVSSPAKTRLALALKDACDSIAAEGQSLLDESQSKDKTFERAPFLGWHGAFPSAPTAHELAQARAELEKVSKTVADLKNGQGRADAISRAEQQHLDADGRLKKLQTVEVKLAKMKASVSALRDACQAIAGEQSFTDQALASLREFARAPEDVSKEIRAYLLKGDAREQSPLTPISTLTSGSLQAHLIGGLADFVYRRARVEAIGYLAQRLDDLLCSEARKPFFKNVCVAFDDLDSSVTLSAIGSYLAAAARKDLERLPDAMLVYALSELTVAPQGAVGCGDNASACEALTGARIALAFYYEVARGRRPLDVARAIHGVTFTRRQVEQAPRSIKALTLASQLLDAIMRQEGWERTRESKDELPYYAISTLLTLEEVRDGWQLKAETLNKRAGWLFQLGALVRRAAEVHARIEAIVETMTKPSGSEDGGQDAADALKLTRSLSRSDLSRASTAALHVMLELPVADLDVEPPAAVSRMTKLSNLGELIASGDAAGSIVAELHDLLMRLIVDATSSTSSAATITNAIFTKVKAALPFATQLARAESADEVATVLEAAAAPVGSYRLKTRKPMVSLTGFVGAAGGFEHLTGQSWGTPLSVFAPLGLHASLPIRGGKLGSWGVMLSVLNLGNLVSERLDNDLERTAGNTTTKVDAAQSESLLSVFSPGVLVTKSIAGPFNAGLGVQVVPSARNVTSTTMTDVGGVMTNTIDTDRRAAIQIMLFVGVDVTILAF